MLYHNCFKKALRKTSNKIVVLIVQVEKNSVQVVKFCAAMCTMKFLHGRKRNDYALYKFVLCRNLYFRNAFICSKFVRCY